MSDPVVSTSATTLKLTSGVMAAGMLFGLNIDAFVIGMFCAACVIGWLAPIPDRRQFIAAVFLTTAVAGFGGPAVHGMLGAVLAKFGIVDMHLDPDVIRRAAAVVFGIVGPTGIPLLLKRLKARGDQAAQCLLCLPPGGAVGALAMLPGSSLYAAALTGLAILIAIRCFCILADLDHVAWDGRRGRFGGLVVGLALVGVGGGVLACRAWDVPLPWWLPAELPLLGGLALMVLCDRRKSTLL